MLSLNHGYGITLNSVYYESIWSPLCKSNIIINLKCLVHILQRSMAELNLLCFKRPFLIKYYFLDKSRRIYQLLVSWIQKSVFCPQKKY